MKNPVSNVVELEGDATGELVIDNADDDDGYVTGDEVEYVNEL